MKTDEFIVSNSSEVTVLINYYGQPDAELAPGEKKVYEGAFPAAGVVITRKNNTGSFRGVTLNANGHPMTLDLR